MCWHLTCCDFLFDTIEVEVDVEIYRLAADIELARFEAERLLRVVSRKNGNTAGTVDSSAAAFIRRFEDQFEGDPPVVEDFTKGWPECAERDGDTGPRSNAALYLGKGEWSASCENHATEAELDRHKQWRREQDNIHKHRAQRLNRRRRVGRALIDWWHGQSGAQDAFQKGMPD